MNNRKLTRGHGTRMGELFVYLFATLSVSSAFATGVEEVSAHVKRAQANFDLEEAEVVFQEAQALEHGSSTPRTRLLLGQAALLLAEMRRLEYEESEDMEPTKRRLLGRTIDDVARIGHEALDSLDDSSEKYRMKADLWVTMIRSSYKGKKYANKMDKAQEKALQLDPSNPRAHVTASKRPLFAPDNRGGDWDVAMGHLNKALSIDPECEVALILRGMAHEQNDNFDAAIADWKTILGRNPNCRPARKNLDRLMGVLAGGS